MRELRTLTFALAATLALAIAPAAFAQDGHDAAPTATDAAHAAETAADTHAGDTAHAADDHVDPYELANNTWISLSGTVHAVSPDTFELDYGEGNITVEMDDGDRDADAYKLLHGDKVTVNGLIDDDLFEMRTIVPKADSEEASV